MRTSTINVSRWKYCWIARQPMAGGQSALHRSIGLPSIPCNAWLVRTSVTQDHHKEQRPIQCSGRARLPAIRDDLRGRQQPSRVHRSKRTPRQEKTNPSTEACGQPASVSFVRVPNDGERCCKRAHVRFVRNMELVEQAANGGIL